MAIPLTREPEEFSSHDGDREHCCFCKTPTSYWYAPKDVAVCLKCAKTHKAAEVPSKEEWFQTENKKSSSRKLRNGEVPCSFPGCGKATINKYGLCKPHRVIKCAFPECIRLLEPSTKNQVCKQHRSFRTLES